jgi:putative DNA primase/helicase
VSLDADQVNDLARIVFPLTDLGNAERLVAAHSHEIRHVAGIGWLVYDGRRWARDDTGGLLRLAKQTARAIYHDAGNCDDNDERKRIAEWARKSESEPRLKAMVSVAASEREVVARPGQLDADPWLLNAANGTVDLRTGQLRDHDPSDLITKLAPVDYRPDARSARWDQLVARATDCDLELASFMQRLAGYTITGVTDEEILAFVHGPGATGKSTFVESISATLGDYASTADCETFLRKRGDAGVRNDIARLAGARIVISVEVDDGKRLAEGLIKTITGGDVVTARFLYSEAFEFIPQFTLCLVANSRPKVNAADDAIWRRILQIPFTVVIPPEERDPELKRALRSNPADQEAILAWLIRGCLDWQQRGLDVPDRVRAYTDEYRQENDPLADWITDDCDLDAQHWTPAKQLRDSYEHWCNDNGQTPVSAQGSAWRTALRNHGCENKARNGKRGWLGIQPRSDVT